MCQNALKQLGMLRAIILQKIKRLSTIHTRLHLVLHLRITIYLHFILRFIF